MIDFGLKSEGVRVRTLKYDEKERINVRTILKEGAPFAAHLLIEHIRNKKQKRLSEVRLKACVYVIDQCIGRPAVQATIQHSGQVTYKQLVEQSGESILAEAQAILAGAGVKEEQQAESEDVVKGETRQVEEPVILLGPPSVEAKE